MGAGVSNGGGIRRPGKRARYRPLAEINVTPFVDVMLVLLIVFMVTAPLLTAGVPVDLPKAQSRNLPQDSKPLEISINHEGAIFLADTSVTIEELIPRLTAIAGTRRDLRIYVRGDRRLDYGRVMAVIGAINSAGFTKVALVSDQS
ncbi:protein TolR [Eilatimonas milleporae]|uniref:Cell division and transport-associated protein TolR n=1 Tax=Eilatimonas milleporae TaxID=911205 RepID=A0A3M0CTB8_9PROT|nr:protein TolR [Eilatimonas milleporae]RMB12185.1 cell division and transport-associated protein TolR [Eilatimonas milleporae]